MNHYRPTAERILDYQPVEVPWPVNELSRELARCQDCGLPFCHAAGCPLGNAIPEINAAAAAARWPAALANLLSTSPFPEFTARVCPALCEGSCVQGLAETAVPCRQVEFQVIERGFADGLVKPRPPRQRIDLSVGVVGSGPAGLAGGARRKRDLAVPGRDLEGVYFAVDYLSAQNRVVGGETPAVPPEMLARGRRVLVIGGGDTGSDCVGTAWRQGALEVTQFEIMPKPPQTRDASNPWPQWPRTLKTTSSHEEGAEREWAVGTIGFKAAEGDEKRVGAVECRRLDWLMENGRPVRSEPYPGSEFERPADLVLLALGFTGAEDSPLTASLNLSADRAGRLPRRADGYAAPDIYICGDMADGPSLVVRAIADGLSVAASALKGRGRHLRQ